jgi:predicted ATPase
MRIESIEVKNYKVFRHIHIQQLPAYAVLLGANGTGKTTFFDLFGFLHQALQENVTTALDKRGGFREVISRGVDPSKECLGFELKFRTEDEAKKSPLATYTLEIGFDHTTGRVIVRKEILKYRRGQKGRPWHFLEFANGTGTAIRNELAYTGQKDVKEERVSQSLKSPDILALKGLGQFTEYPVVSSFRVLLEKWYVSNFQIDQARSLTDAQRSPHLSVTGDNLANVARYLKEYYPDAFEAILKKIPERIPGIREVEARLTEDGRVLLRFRDQAFTDPFISRYVSDGTIKLFAYLVLLHDPDPHPLLCIEEPENFLHLDLLLPLCEEIRAYAERSGQVLVSTHSPDFVDGVKLDELFYLRKQDGFSTIDSAASTPGLRELYEAGNSLGWLWRNGYISGARLQSTL